MQYEAFPEGRNQACRSRIDEELFGSALELFNAQRFAESLSLLQGALGRPAGPAAAAGEPSLRDGAVLLAWNLHQLRRYEECREWLRSAAADGLLPADDPEAVLVELWIQWSEGRYNRIIQAAGRYIEKFRGELHPLLAEFLFIRGSTRIRLGEYGPAQEDCESAHALFKLLKKQQQQAEVSNSLGLVHFQQSRYEESLKWFRESLRLNSELGLQRRVGDNYLNIGLACYKKGDYEQAHRQLARAVQTHTDIDSPNLLCRAKIGLGNVSRLQRDFRKARSHLMAAYTLATDRRLLREECLALEFLGDVLRDEGKPREARRYYARGMAIASRIAPEGDLVMELLRREGECLELLDQLDEAVSVLERARRLAAKLGDRFEEGVILRCLASAQAKRKDWPLAKRLIEDSLSLLANISAHHEQAVSHLLAAGWDEARADRRRRKIASDRLEESLSHALAARQLFRALKLPEGVTEADRLVSSLAWRHLDAVGTRDKEQGVVSAAEVAAGAEVVAVSADMRAALARCDSFAPFEEPVLITGDTGTGKELIARRLHQRSRRWQGPFVAVNCAAVPATLFEREFFGHHKGAYTGAEDDRPGFVAQANGGTLFLDEVGDLPLELQPKLLRLLQEGTFNRLGDPREHQADIRLVAATNANLDQLVAAGKFRQDLNYRLKVLEISLKPLRDRREDIIPLLQHFLGEVSGRQVTVWNYFDNESVQVMRRYCWPGNVREVIMIARRAHISLESRGRTEVQLGTGPEAICLTGPARHDGPGEINRARIVQVLEETSGNKAEAARQLGIARQTLYRWLRRCGIPT